MAETLLTNVRPWGAAPVDLLLIDGHIGVAGPHLRLAHPDTPVIDGGGRLVLPGLIDGHAHIDKTLWGQPWRPHRAGPRLIDKIEHERRVRHELRLDPAEQSAQIARECISRGTTHIRTHVDIDTESGLANLHGVLATRAALRNAVDIQIVAFPQSGLLSRPGTLELVEAALRQGAEVVGGIDPAGIDRDPQGQLDAIFSLADRYGVEIDIHLHDPDELGALQIDMIAERTRALGMQGRVAISHAFCLGQVAEARYQGLEQQLVELDIAIMTHAPGNRPFPPILRLQAAGVRLFSGNDGIRDAWGPFGNGDMLERAWILSYRSNFRKDEEVEVALQLCSSGGAAVLRVPHYGLTPGCRADLVVVDGETPTMAVMDRRPRAYVFKGGVVVAADGACLV
jgi:cytosine/adenosine deaminase-related metal-dependent hydrolase